MIKPSALSRTALIAIHDVMPENFRQVIAIIRFLADRQVERFTLLVVPGKNWSLDQINQLKTLQQQGLELAGHGWRHRADRTDTVWHRLHGKMISRAEAEHLSLSETEVAGIITRCYQWFVAAGLKPPVLYVPPAWALGALSRKGRQILPFELYETQTGLYSVPADEHYPLPVTGYMADTRLRTVSLKLSNAVNLGLPLAPTRIAIHPDDLRLPLSPDLIRHLHRFRRFLTYTDLFDRAPVTVAVPCHRKKTYEGAVDHHCQPVSRKTHETFNL